MADLENRFEKLEGRVSSVEISVEKLSQKVDDFIAESRRNAERQDARMQQLEQRMDAMNQRMDATMTTMTQRMDAMNQRMDAMNQRMDDSVSQIRNLTIASTGGIVTIAVAVLAFVATH